MWEFHTCSFQYTGSHIIRDLHMPFGGTAFPLVIFAILFYFGQSFNSNMMELSITIYQSEWYQYPRSVQRFVLLMMQRSQRPFYFSAYGLMELHLQNYLGVSEMRKQTRLMLASNYIYWRQFASVWLIEHFEYICSCSNVSIRRSWSCREWIRNEYLQE